MIVQLRPFFPPFGIHTKKLIPTMVILSVLAIAGCASGPDQKPPPEPMALGDILVLPFQNMYKIYGKSVSFKCPLCGAVHMVGKVEEGADSFLTHLLYEKVKESRNFNFIGPGQATGARSAVMSESPEDIDEKTLILKTGKAVGAKQVLIGQVFRFEERIGTSYSVEKPASAAFDLLLYDVSDGRLLWSGHFDETQQPLNENLFKLGLFLKRNARWLTAEELAEDGLETMLESFPRPM